MSKIPIYFMPGLAASSSIFENIKLPNNQFELHYLEWFIPTKKETLAEYAQKMASFVKHENAVLIGVSFGGVLVQEMAQFLNLDKIIIISSIKSSDEMPNWMKIAKQTKAYKILPTSMLKDIEVLAKYAFGTLLKSRLVMYKKYLTMNDKVYLDWAIEQVICWDRTKIDPKVIHIHGDTDSVFPSENIKFFIPVKNGTHAMIITKFRWFNDNLPKIILEKSVCI
jgi:pimeloyl-ACP methyl ester carboxylesterase